MDTKTIFTILVSMVIMSSIPTISAFSVDRVVTVLDSPELVPIDVSSEVYGFNGTHYNETTVETVMHFLTNLPPCPWHAPDATNVCSLAARYRSISARDVGLTIGECTVKDGNISRIKRTLCFGHRVNVFMDNGNKYYYPNLYVDDIRVLDSSEFADLFCEVMGSDHVATTDYKW